MSPTDSFRPTLSLPVEQAMSFLSLASRRIPEDEQLETARDLGLSATAVVDENAFSETAQALWESMNRASATMTMASLTPTHPTHRNLRIWLSRPYATVARARGEKIHIYRIDTEEILTCPLSSSVPRPTAIWTPHKPSWSTSPPSAPPTPSSPRPCSTANGNTPRGHATTSPPTA